MLWQQRDNSTESAEQMKPVTTRAPQPAEYDDLVFANIIVKHSKSNAIVIARNSQLCASGIGQTSRVDALKQAIEKAGHSDLILTDLLWLPMLSFPLPTVLR